MQPQLQKANAVAAVRLPICQGTLRPGDAATASRKSSNRPGRPSFHPTEKHRKLARLLASRGIPQDTIARFIAISPKTLRKHLRRELTLGGIEANLAVLKALHKMACSGNRQHLAAAIFWAKSRCGFNASSPAAAPIYSPSPHIYIYRREKPLAAAA